MLPKHRFFVCQITLIFLKSIHFSWTTHNVFLPLLSTFLVLFISKSFLNRSYLLSCKNNLKEIGGAVQIRWLYHSHAAAVVVHGSYSFMFIVWLACGGWFTCHNTTGQGGVEVILLHLLSLSYWFIKAFLSSPQSCISLFYRYQIDIARQNSQRMIPLLRRACNTCQATLFHTYSVMLLNARVNWFS